MQGDFRHAGRVMAKPLPSKICPVCERPFNWRRKWAKDWDNVRYCSERCRRNRALADDPGSGPGRVDVPAAGAGRHVPAGKRHKRHR